jgi:lipopolysaccharide assembly outer membrane protein LptD (OstA)
MVGIILFFFTYYSREKDEIVDIGKSAETGDVAKFTEDTSNIIDDVSYVGTSGGTIFELNASRAEIKYGEPDISHLQNVFVVIKMNERTIHIKSDKALYNKTTNDCEFWGNVEATEQDNIITSDNLDLFMSKNLITAYNNLNVKYNNMDGLGYLIADKVNIDILKNETNIFMFEKDSKVRVKYKN